MVKIKNIALLLQKIQLTMKLPFHIVQLLRTQRCQTPLCNSSAHPFVLYKHLTMFNGVMQKNNKSFSYLCTN